MNNNDDWNQLNKLCLDKSTKSYNKWSYNIDNNLIHQLVLMVFIYDPMSVMMVGSLSLSLSFTYSLTQSLSLAACQQVKSNNCQHYWPFSMTFVWRVMSLTLRSIPHYPPHFIDNGPLIKFVQRHSFVVSLWFFRSTLLDHLPNWHTHKERERARNTYHQAKWQLPVMSCVNHLSFVFFFFVDSNFVD